MLLSVDDTGTLNSSAYSSASSRLRIFHSARVRSPELGIQRHRGQLKPHLIVPFAGAAVAIACRLPPPDLDECLPSAARANDVPSRYIRS